MSGVSGEAITFAEARSRGVVITALGVTQIFAWGSSYYLLAVLAEPIAAETGWARAWIVGGVSLGLLTAGAISPWVGRAIAALGGRPVLAVSAGFLGDWPPRAGAGAIASSLCGGLAGDRIGHGRGPLRSGLCNTRAPLRPWRTLSDHHTDPVRRLREHDMLASFSASRSPFGMARRVHGLRWLSSLRRAPSLFSCRAARASTIVASASATPSQALAATQGEAPRHGSLALLAATVTLASVISTTLSYCRFCKPKDTR